MIADVTSFAHRCLRKLPRFKACGLPMVPKVELAYPLELRDLAPDDTLLGVYENSLDSPDDLITFTRQRVILCSTVQTAFDYAKIRSVKYGKSTPTRDGYLVVVETRAGDCIRFKVLGFAEQEYGAKTFDSYAIGMFLDKAAGSFSE